MGHIFWISGAAVAAALAIGAKYSVVQDAQPLPAAAIVVSDAPEPVSTDEFAIGTTGSALATAAFGLSALQPETFNGEIVRDIIEASPLEYGEKDRLTAKLMAAKAGQAQLPDVLQDIRVALAVE